MDSGELACAVPVLILVVLFFIAPRKRATPDMQRTQQSDNYYMMLAFGLGLIIAAVMLAGGGR